MKICRLCLYEGDEKQVLSIWENEIEDLSTKILNCVSINITRDDELSRFACVSCIHQVTQWEVFRNICRKSNEILLKTAIEKTEEESMIDSNNDTDDNLKNDDGCMASTVLHKTQKIRHKETDKQFFKTEQSESDDYKSIELSEEDLLDLSIGDALIKNIYQCEICNVEIDNCFEFLDHQHTHNGEPLFQCDKCSDVFDLRKELVEHDKNHRTSCPHCGKLILKTSMNLHLVKHTDRFRCTKCGARFNSNATLSQHVITVHTNIKDHICEMCGKRFSSPTAMRVHMKSHSDERLYPCRLCNYAGRTASAIYVHMSTHSNDLYVCEVCSKTFKSNRNLNDHLRRVHTKEKKHQCSYCDKKFVDKYMLRVHERSHTGVRPYKCTFCEKSFIRSDGLKEHVAIHGQRVLHECKHCGKKFTSKRGLVRHNCVSVT